MVPVLLPEGPFVCISKSYLLLLGPELISFGLESCPDVPVGADRSNVMPYPSYACGMLLSQGVPRMKVRG